MQTSINQFRENIKRARSLGAIYQTLESQATSELDLSDLLRSQLVMAVSALDLYVHELVRLGMLEIYRGNRKQTDSYLRFQITMSSALQAISAPGNIAWLNDQIKARHGHLSFQNPANIADAIRIISDEQLWNAVSALLRIRPQDARGQLTAIVDRRNQIAHESDINPSLPNALWQINHRMVDDAVTFIENLAEAIHTVVA